jgi:selenocysteine lyase/cysteine desulfurase
MNNSQPPARNIASARGSFPGLSDKTFLDAACVSLAPLEAKMAIEAFLGEAMACPAADASEHHIRMDQARRRATEEAARLLSASERNVALVESTTHGLGIAASIIPLGEGDTVLIADSEFLQVAIPWVTRSRRDGAEICPVRSVDGALPTEAFAAQIDDRTRVVCVSSVQWSSGYRVDIPALSELCRDRGIWLVVDAIQELGALQVDATQWSADFIIAGGHKWLNAPFGCGVMFMSDRAIAELEPPFPGYLSLEDPPGGWGTFFRTPGFSPIRPYEFPATARAFEIGGTANYPGAIGLAASLALINSIGPDQIERHVLELGATLRRGLEELGTRVVLPIDAEHRSGITTFSFHPTPEEDYGLLEKLLADRIYLSMRYTGAVGGLRVSTHFYNSAADIDALLESLARNT